MATLDCEDGFPVGPSCNLSKVYSLTPLLSNNKVLCPIRMHCICICVHIHACVYLCVYVDLSMSSFWLTKCYSDRYNIEGSTVHV